MKKTIVALAVLSASAAAFANVSITGTLEGGYISSASGFWNANDAKNGVAKDSSGFGMKKSQINILATEDLGNGLSVAAQLGLQGADRSGANDLANSNTGAVTGGDSFIKLISPFGTLGLASAAGAGSYLTGPGTISGVAGYDFAGNNAAYNLYGAMTTNNTISYSSTLGPVEVEVMHDQATANPIGQGMTGNTSGQQDNGISATYKQGGLALNAQYYSYDSQESKNFTMPLAKQQWRAQAGYDFGVAKVGAGVTNVSMVNGQPDAFTWLLGAAVPVGPLTLGAQVTKVTSGINTQQAAVNADSKLAANMQKADQFGVAYTAQYNLSKQTALKAAYARWQATNTTGYNTEEVSVLLSHAF